MFDFIHGGGWFLKGGKYEKSDEEKKRHPINRQRLFTLFLGNVPYCICAKAQV
jgi:hypothetical protein